MQGNIISYYSIGFECVPKYICLSPEIKKEEGSFFSIFIEIVSLSTLMCGAVG